MSNESKMSTVSLVVAIASVVAAIASAMFSWQANTISREAYRRASGRMLPLFTVECNTPHLLVVGDKATEPETLLVTFRNDGTEAIEAVRYDILMDILWTGDRAKNQPIKPSRVLSEFNRILQPGQTETIDIAPDVAAHIKTLGIPKGKESFWTPCSVSFSAKIVGSTYFASTVDENKNINYNKCSFGVTWDAKPGVKKEPVNFGVDLAPRN